MWFIPVRSIIREWTEFKNVGSGAFQALRSGISKRQRPVWEIPSSVDFDWMTGGENAHGSWTLKTEKLNAGQPRRFDSYDPFPIRRRVRRFCR